MKSFHVPIHMRLNLSFLLSFGTCLRFFDSSLHEHECVPLESNGADKGPATRVERATARHD